MSAVHQKLSQSLKKQAWFPVFSWERKTTYWAGSHAYVKMWPALRKGWHQGEPTNYDDDDKIDDNDDDDDDNDDDDDDDINDGNVVFFFINIFL